MSGILGTVAIAFLALACAVPVEPETSSPQSAPTEPVQVPATSARTPTDPAPTLAFTLNPPPTAAPTATHMNTPTAVPTATATSGMFPRKEVPTITLDRAQALRDRAEEYAAVWQEQDWERLYQLIIDIAPEFQEACGFPEFYAQMTLAWELIRAFSFSDANTKIELRVVDVQVTGDTGVVHTDWFFDGLSGNEHPAKQFEGAEVTPVEESNKQEWVFVDGQWRERTESNWDPSQGCPKAEIQQ